MGATHPKMSLRLQHLLILAAIAFAAADFDSDTPVPEELVAETTTESTQAEAKAQLHNDLLAIFDHHPLEVKTVSTRMLLHIASKPPGIAEELDLWSDSVDDMIKPKFETDDAGAFAQAGAKAKAGWHRWRPHAHIPHRWRPHVHVPHRYNPVRAIKRTWNSVKRVAATVGNHIKRGAKAVWAAAKKAGAWAFAQLKKLAGKVCRTAIAKIGGRLVRYLFKRATSTCIRLCSRVGIWIATTGGGNPASVTAAGIVGAGCGVACKLAARTLKRILGHYRLTASCLGNWICTELKLPGPSCRPRRL